MALAFKTKEAAQGYITPKGVFCRVVKETVARSNATNGKVGFIAG